MEGISNCTTNVANHWKVVLPTAIVSIALIILGIMNLNMRHFYGLGHMGSNIMLGVGAGVVLLTCIIACINTPSRELAWQPIAGSDAGSPKKKIVFTITKEFVKFTSSEESSKASKALRPNQVLFAEYDQNAVVYYINCINKTNYLIFSADPATMTKLLDEVHNGTRSLLPKNIIDEAIKADEADDFTESDGNLSQYQQLLYTDEVFTINNQATDKDGPVDGDRIRGPSVCAISPALLKLRLKNSQT